MYNQMLVDDDNSYKEPTYNAEDQSDSSYEATYYQKSQSIDQLAMETPQQQQAIAGSDTESMHEQTYDQNLGQRMIQDEDGEGTYDDLEEQNNQGV